MGVKVKSSIDYKQKVVRYGNINKIIKANRGEYWKSLDLPEYENNNLWQTIYANKTKSFDLENSKEDFMKKYPNALSFRDYCYKEAESDQQLSQCGDDSTYNSWCEACLIDTSSL